MILKTCSRSKVSKKPWRSEAYSAFIHSLPCLATGVHGVQAHHVRVGLRTMGVRKSDRLLVPLSPSEHMKLHSMREESYWAELGVDVLRWCEATFEKWSAA